VHVRGGRLACALYDNDAGKEIGRLDVENDRHVMGRVGLGTFLSAYRFRNIRVTAPGGQVLWEGAPAVESLKRTESAKPVDSPKPTGVSHEAFVQLFNGIDLTGWKTHPSQPGNWHVENGNLVGSGPAEVSHLYTVRDEYKDFHLRVEARVNRGGKSGVYFRAPFGPRRPANVPQWPIGFEAQIDCSNPDHAKTGSLASSYQGTVVQLKESPVPAGRWFTLEVIAQSNHIVVKVDDRKTADYIDERGLLTSGHIALQQWKPETIVEFRKIEINELPPSSSTVDTETRRATPTVGKTDAPRTDDTFHSLFNGRDLSGWHVEGGDAADWRVEEGVIVARGQGFQTRSYLLTDREYADFAMRLEFNLEKGSGSGVGARAYVREQMPINNNDHIFDHPLIKLIESPGREQTGTTHWIRDAMHVPPGRHANLRPAGSWNLLEVQVQGSAMRAWVNRQAVLDMELGPGSKFPDGTVPALNRISGRIGLQKHTGTVRFRDIEITDSSGMRKERPSGSKRRR
jgi:hypothetical protein